MGPLLASRYAQIKVWRPEASKLLVEVLHRGEITRGDAATITGLGERTTRYLLALLLGYGVRGSTTEKGSVGLRFTVASQEILLPRLFAEQ